MSDFDLFVVKELSDGGAIVRCNKCLTYYIVNKIQYSSLLSGGDFVCESCQRFSNPRLIPVLGVHQPYGMLRPLARVIEDTGKVSLICKCDCGSFVIRRDSVVTCGYSKSCGCRKGKFYGFEWKGEEDYFITSDDLKYMDKLVCSLDDGLRVGNVSIVSPRDSEDKSSSNITLESLRERFMSATSMEEDVVDEVVEDASEEIEDSSDEVEQVVEEEPTVENILLGNAPASVCAPVNEPVLEDEQSPQVEKVPTESASSDDSIVREDTKTMKGSGISIFHVEYGFSNVLRVAKETLTKEGYSELDNESASIGSLVEFLGDSAKKNIDSLVSSIYNSNDFVFVKKNDNKVVSVIVLTENSVTLYSLLSSDFIANSLLRLLGGLYVHTS